MINEGRVQLDQGSAQSDLLIGIFWSEDAPGAHDHVAAAIHSGIPRPDGRVDHVAGGPSAKGSGHPVEDLRRGFKVAIGLSGRQAENNAFYKGEGIHGREGPVYSTGIGCGYYLEKRGRHSLVLCVTVEQRPQSVRVVEGTSSRRGIRAVQIERYVVGNADKGTHGRDQFSHHLVRVHRTTGVRFDQVDPKGDGQPGGCEAPRHRFRTVVGHPVIDHDRFILRYAEQPGAIGIPR